MQYIIKKVSFTLFIMSVVISQNPRNQNNGDPLSETPLYPIPQKMTFEEYQDMNRRLSQGYIWSIIPVPGITHYYAGEQKIAKRLFYIGLGGLSCFIAGAISMDDPSWPEFDPDIHIIHNEGSKNELWYEKVPIGVDGDNIQYSLEEVRKESVGNGSGLVALGAIIIIGDFIYDRVKGMDLIEKKRDKVRFKYGKQLNLSLEPSLNIYSRRAKLGMRVSFGLSKG